MSPMKNTKKHNKEKGVSQKVRHHSSGSEAPGKTLPFHYHQKPHLAVLGERVGEKNIICLH